LLTVRYGAKLLPIANGMTAIEVCSLSELPNTITTVMQAVDAEELDTELAAASKDRQFVKTKVDKRARDNKKCLSAFMSIAARRLLWAC
jgi:hypothetical protein